MTHSDHAQYFARRDVKSMVFIELLSPQISSGFCKALSQELRAIEVKDQTNLVVITGQGPDFCTGMDFSELMESVRSSENIKEKVFASAQAFYDLLICISNVNFATVAVVNGNVRGGGVGIVASCDYAICSREVSMSLPEIYFEAIPAIVLPFLRQKVGHSSAVRLAMMGDAIDCEKSLSMGLIDGVFESPDKFLNALVLKLNRSRSSARKRLRVYAEKISGIFTEKMREVAIAENADMVLNSNFVKNVERFQSDGILPFQVRQSKP